jgi:hypothetical protein
MWNGRFHIGPPLLLCRPLQISISKLYDLRNLVWTKLGFVCDVVTGSLVLDKQLSGRTADADGIIGRGGALWGLASRVTWADNTSDQLGRILF